MSRRAVAPRPRPARAHAGRAHAPGRRASADAGYHVVRFGPFGIGGEPASCYVAVTATELLPPLLAETDAEGLAQVVAAHGDRPRTCGDELLAAGRRLGFRAGVPAAWALPALASLAVQIDHGPTIEVARTPAAIDGFLRAFTRYAAATPWQYWTDRDDLVLTTTVGGAATVVHDVCVMGSGEVEYGLSLIEGRGGAARLRAALAREDARAIHAVATIGASIEESPRWAAAAVGAAYGLPLAPCIIATDRAGRRAATPHDLRILTAAMALVATMTPDVGRATLELTGGAEPALRAALDRVGPR